MGILAFFGCEAIKLSPKETALVNKLDFNIELMKELKKETNSELIQLPVIEKETADVLDGLHNGIHADVSEEIANSIVIKLKEKFRVKGLLIFVFSGEIEAKSIAVLKGVNDLDIIRYRRTNGINHDYENEDIISKLVKWNDNIGVTVIGCGRDWLELRFNNMPIDLNAFSEEVYEFCPDFVDQGVGEVENLKVMIEEINGIWLWWD